MKEETITKYIIDYSKGIRQGEIIKNVDYIEYATQKDGFLEVSKINFPLIIILTQDCDAIQYSNNIELNIDHEKYNNNQYLLSIIVAPIYNFEDVRLGKYLENLEIIKDGIITDKKMKCTGVSSKELRQNNLDRYHYIKIKIGDSFSEYVIDFKHYFTVNADYIIEHKIDRNNYLFTIDSIFKESINQRFANYLSRIGLPTVPKSE